MKIIIAPDSFKGTLSAIEVCKIITEGIRSVITDAEIISIPIADGGEGTIDAFHAQHVNVKVTGSDFKMIDSYYGKFDDIAVIEMAACAGLTLTSVQNPELTTTYGVGELINHALENGFRKFIIGLGGSATNDAGTGMAAALGVKFGTDFIPAGGTLIDIDRIDMSGINKKIYESEFTTMCDITNPLYGPNGAAHIFAPQKGADAEMVERLDAGLRHFAQFFAPAVSTMPGGGAAGGMGCGTHVFLNSKLKSGIDVVLDTAKFDKYLNGADLVIGGEGKFDNQSIHGKAVSGIAKRTKKAGVPFIVVAGAVGDDFNADEAYEMGITSIFSIQRAPLPFELSKLRSKKDLFDTIHNILRILKI
ncbi:MAG: glycerate kinase [Oscillospiraceae bacterium]|nr:glycerate kinase [Oscillospiraceae bacterium]